jgi:hypothetical protein
LSGKYLITVHLLLAFTISYKANLTFLVFKRK